MSCKSILLTWFDRKKEVRYIETRKQMCRLTELIHMVHQIVKIEHNNLQRDCHAKQRKQTIFVNVNYD